jgi:hypothetical protein
MNVAYQLANFSAAFTSVVYAFRGHQEDCSRNIRKNLVLSLVEIYFCGFCSGPYDNVDEAHPETDV